MADTWLSRRRAESEAAAWADEPIGTKGKSVRAEKKASDDGEARMKRDEEIGHIETQKGLRGYLGHFANDDVLREGHNVGAKPLGKAYGVDQGMAKNGYRVVGGSASPLVGKSNYHGRHYGDEVDRMENEARETGLKEPKAVTSRRVKREAETLASLKEMPFPAMATKPPKPKAAPTLPKRKMKRG